MSPAREDFSLLPDDAGDEEAEASELLLPLEALEDSAGLETDVTRSTCSLSSSLLMPSLLKAPLCTSKVPASRFGTKMLTPTVMPA
jgi:hypothetical protein